MTNQELLEKATEIGKKLSEAYRERNDEEWEFLRLELLEVYKNLR
jgi:hypothetical protein